MDASTLAVGARLMESKHVNVDPGLPQEHERLRKLERRNRTYEVVAISMIFLLIGTLLGTGAALCVLGSQGTLQDASSWNPFVLWRLAWASGSNPTMMIFAPEAAELQRAAAGAMFTTGAGCATWGAKRLDRSQRLRKALGWDEGGQQVSMGYLAGGPPAGAMNTGTLNMGMNVGPQFFGHQGSLPNQNMNYNYSLPVFQTQYYGVPGGTVVTPQPSTTSRMVQIIVPGRSVINCCTRY